MVDALSEDDGELSIGRPRSPRWSALNTDLRREYIGGLPERRQAVEPHPGGGEACGSG